MAKIVPFKGILYNVSEVSMEDVLAPPYDIITPEYREELYKKSPYNIVRIDFGKDQPGDNEIDNKYTRARRNLDAWIHDGILIRSGKPSFYAYEMSYEINRERKRLLGFLGLVQLEELGKGSIYPHECTYSKPKLDRLNLMRSCEANISPIFSLYKSPEKKASMILSRITTTKPYFEVEEAAGVVHRLWQIDEMKDIETIKKDLEDKAIFIADGHHRYETALEFRREMTEKGISSSESKPFDYVLMFLANMLDNGLTILPTHRLVKEIPEGINKMISEYFEIEPVRADFDIEKRLSGRRCVFGFFKKGDQIWYLLHYKGGNLSEIHPDLREIDVIILHELLLKRLLKTTELGYEMDIQKTIDKVRSGEFGAAFFLNPTRVKDVEKSGLSSTRMPPKSTYFFPKLLTGIVMHSFLNG